MVGMAHTFKRTVVIPFGHMSCSLKAAQTCSRTRIEVYPARMDHDFHWSSLASRIAQLTLRILFAISVSFGDVVSLERCWQSVTV